MFARIWQTAPALRHARMRRLHIQVTHVGISLVLRAAFASPYGSPFDDTPLSQRVPVAYPDFSGPAGSPDYWRYSGNSQSDTPSDYDGRPNPTQTLGSGSLNGGGFSLTPGSRIGAQSAARKITRMPCFEDTDCALLPGTLCALYSLRALAEAEAHAADGKGIGSFGPGSGREIFGASENVGRGRVLRAERSGASSNVQSARRRSAGDGRGAELKGASTPNFLALWASANEMDPAVHDEYVKRSFWGVIRSTLTKQPIGFCVTPATAAAASALAEARRAGDAFEEGAGDRQRRGANGAAVKRGKAETSFFRSSLDGSASAGWGGGSDNEKGRFYDEGEASDRYGGKGGMLRLAASPAETLPIEYTLPSVMRPAVKASGMVLSSSEIALSLGASSLGQITCFPTTKIGRVPKSEREREYGHDSVSFRGPSFDPMGPASSSGAVGENGGGSGGGSGAGGADVTSGIFLAQYRPLLMTENYAMDMDHYFVPVRLVSETYEYVLARLDPLAGESVSVSVIDRRQLRVLLTAVSEIAALANLNANKQEKLRVLSQFLDANVLSRLQPAVDEMLAALDSATRIYFTFFEKTQSIEMPTGTLPLSCDFTGEGAVNVEITTFMPNLLLLESLADLLRNGDRYTVENFLNGLTASSVDQKDCGLRILCM